VAERTAQDTAARRLDPFGTAALAAAGTLCAHEAGYFIGGSSAVSHEYLGVVGPLVALAACLAAWGAALRVLRHDPGRAPTMVALTAAQSGIFVVMELAERAVTGSIASITSWPVITGLLLQPLVAWLALRILSVGHTVLSALTTPQATLRPTALISLACADAQVTGRIDTAQLRLRGPPVN
jgi:hypothetical protein